VFCRLLFFASSSLVGVVFVVDDDKNVIESIASQKTLAFLKYVLSLKMRERAGARAIRPPGAARDPIARLRERKKLSVHLSERARPRQQP